MNIKIISLISILYLCIFQTVYGQSITDLKNRAEYRNDSWAQNKLGLSYEQGDGVPMDLPTAYSWYMKAANNNYSYGQYNVARFWHYGYLGSKNMEKALYWYKKAASNYHSASCLQLGKWYLNGENVVKDVRLSYKYFKDAAFTGSPEGKYFMGWCSAHGVGTKQDSVRTMVWLNRAIDDKYFFSYYLLGYLYQNAVCFSKNLDMAIVMYKEGADNNDTSCMNSLGIIYWNGDGVDSDKDKAIEYYKKAAEGGNKYAQSNLADKYYYGNHINQDYSLSAYWFKKAVDNGYTNDIEKLVSILEHIDDTELFKYATIGANLNNTECMNSLAYCYAEGKGTNIDIKNALNIIETAIKIKPSDPNYYDSKGEFLLKKKSYKQAAELWEKVKSMDPSFYSTYSTKLNDYMTKKNK